MKPISGQLLCQAPERAGWELKRIKGSHHIFAQEGETVRISVPVHGKRPLKRGLLNHLMRTAKLDESDLK